MEQSRGNLNNALHAAKQAAELAPQLGYAHARLAELLLSFNRYTTAHHHIALAQSLCPNNPLVPTLQGFALLDQNQPAPALAAFRQATSLDPALGLAWLGQGLASLRLHRLTDAETAILTATALEPNRAAFRSALARVYADSGDSTQAAHELELASTLDPGDPSPWLYSALIQHQLNQPIPAINSMERSRNLNHNQAVFRSQLLLDRDQATRSANLATLYADTGLSEPGQRSASRSIIQDYSNPAGHLFLANTYQQLDDPYRTNLRLETARQSELLLANLLAPPGSGNLSQLLSQQDHLRLLQPPQTAFSSLTEITSQGDWSQSGSVFGNLGEFSYAVDAQYRSLQGDWNNQDLEEFLLSTQIKEQLTLHDALYLQVGTLQLESGDTARHLSPTDINNDIRTQEHQRPFLHLGLNHAWSPEHHTLLLGSFVEDQLNLEDPELTLPFLRMNADTPSFITPAPLFAYTTDSHDRLGSAELQHIWQTEPNTLVIGSRAQIGEISTTANLSRAFTGPITRQTTSSTFNRVSAYAYNTWHILQPLHLTAGFSYDHLQYPENPSTPISPDKTTSASQWSPKAGLAYQPQPNTEIRAACSQSLGGLYFDNSLRLEPTQTAKTTMADEDYVQE